MDGHIWNPWHGCKKYSEGCLNCYVYRRDSKYGLDASCVTKNNSFNLPLKKDRKGNYKTPPGSKIYACFTSDFFLEEADIWRSDAWNIIRERRDIDFFMITKRIVRVAQQLPKDWGAGYDNVTIACTMENQHTADERLPVYQALSLKHRTIICEPLLSEIVFPSLKGISSIVCGGESGEQARVCDWNWVLSLRQQCIAAGVSFYFKQTGANFLKDGKLYKIPRSLQHKQARKAAIDC